MIRYALIRNARTRREVEAYLPDNFKIIHEDEACTFGFRNIDGSVPTDRPRHVFVIEGTDSAGWGLDSYVKPRMASGMLYAEEIDLSHPIMKVIPA